MKLRKIVEASPAFKKLSAAELSFAKLYAVNKLLDSVDSELKFFDENRLSIIKKHSADDRILTEDIDKINAEIEDLLNTDVCVKYRKVTLTSEDRIMLSRNDMKSLEGFVDFVFAEVTDEKEENDNDEA